MNRQLNDAGCAFRSVSGQRISAGAGDLCVFAGLDSGDSGARSGVVSGGVVSPGVTSGDGLVTFFSGVTGTTGFPGCEAIFFSVGDSNPLA